MNKDILLELLKQNQFTSHFSLDRVTEENARLRLNEGTASMVRRPSAARVAPRFSPLVQASRADASGFERVPLDAAGARPAILPAGRPAAEGQRMRGPEESMPFP